MQIDLHNSLRSLSDTLHDALAPRPDTPQRSVAHSVAEHLAHHAAGSRLMESLTHWGDERGSAGGQSSFDRLNAQTTPGPQAESPLALVLEDILEEINGGTGSGIDADMDDAYSNEDLFRDLAEMFAQRRKPIGENDVGSQSEFGSANNPFCGALFGAWEAENDQATLRDRHDASLLLLLKLVAMLGRRKLLALLDVGEDDGKARYDEGDQDLLFEIAGFMDQHPVRYPPPSASDGEWWTWTERIARGTALDARETRLFQLALEQLDMALARLAGERMPLRRRNKRSREDIEFHLSVTGSARNVLRLMCA